MTVYITFPHKESIISGIFQLPLHLSRIVQIQVSAYPNLVKAVGMDDKSRVALRRFSLPSMLV